MLNNVRAKIKYKIESEEVRDLIIKLMGYFSIASVIVGLAAYTVLGLLFSGSINGFGEAFAFIIGVIIATPIIGIITKKVLVLLIIIGFYLMAILKAGSIEEVKDLLSGRENPLSYL